MVTALSVVAPSGQRIREGRKTIEVRRWQPVSLPLRHLLIVENQHYLKRGENEVDPEGYGVAWVTVSAVSSWTEAMVEMAGARVWAPGYWAWHLENVRPVPHPFWCEARLGLYELEVMPTVGEGALDGLSRNPSI